MAIKTIKETQHRRPEIDLSGPEGNAFVFMLVGLPGTGKSTYCEKNLEPALQLRGDFFYYSTDFYLDELAKRLGETYDNVFQANINIATIEMNRGVREAIQNQQDVIWDQTNMTVKARSRKLAEFPEIYRKIAIVFEVPDNVLQHRLANRPGKTIPAHVIKSMQDSYQPPTIDEGFAEIVVIPYDEN